jgi:hypothetical protein
VIAFLCSKHKVLSSHTSTAKELIFKFVWGKCVNNFSDAYSSISKKKVKKEYILNVNRKLSVKTLSCDL